MDNAELYISIFKDILGYLNLLKIEDPDNKKNMRGKNSLISFIEYCDNTRWINIAIFTPTHHFFRFY
ncbi:MAG: hypothetical protein PVG39_13140 [Desulfobacteraceae bacterium]|jgi:hypothetical protein